MANVNWLVGEFDFVDQSIVDVQHDQNAPVAVQVVVGGVVREDLISSLVLDASDPRNRMAVHLLSEQTGRVQVFTCGLQSVSEPTPEEGAALAKQVAGERSHVLDVVQRTGQMLGSNAEDLAFDDEALITGAVFDHVTKGEIEFLVAGKIFVTGGLTLQQTAGSQRTMGYGWLEHQASGGSYVKIQRSATRIYLRNSAKGGRFGGSTVRAALQVGVGDRLKFVAQRLEGSGTITTIANECNLVIHWMPL